MGIVSVFQGYTFHILATAGAGYLYSMGTEMLQVYKMDRMYARILAFASIPGMDQNLLREMLAKAGNVQPDTSNIKKYLAFSVFALFFLVTQAIVSAILSEKGLSLQQMADLAPIHLQVSDMASLVLGAYYGSKYSKTSK